jgi:small subunit ribosomal protein S11
MADAQTSKELEALQTKSKKKEEVKEGSEKFDNEPKEERAGIAHIYASGNNTIVHITDMAGSTISRVSGGMITKHDRLKSNPTVAMFVAKKAAERAKDLGINSLYIRLRGETGGTGIGPGGHAVVKSLSKEGFRVINVLDATRAARGGPKKKGGKRGRRV